MINKKLKITIILIFIITVALLCFSAVNTKANWKFFDTTWSFDYAYISLPNGEVVEGNVENWRDYEDGDQVQVTINNITYLTDTTRCVLVCHH